uniref:Uncharacterized protein n=1 Tax=viral metagenome TaxID=1070528 RepID=A0A6C0AEL0_9ZZZZ
MNIPIPSAPPYIEIIENSILVEDAILVEEDVLVEEDNNFYNNINKVSLIRNLKKSFCIGLIVIIFFIMPIIFIALSQSLYNVENMTLITHTIQNTTCTLCLETKDITCIKYNVINCYESNLIYSKNTYSCYYPYEKNNYDYKNTINNAKNKINSKKKFITNTNKKKCQKEPLFIKGIFAAGIIILIFGIVFTFWVICIRNS